MDRIIALYSTPARAIQARTHLFADGFAADRLDVITRQDPGRAAEGPHGRLEDNLRAHFEMLLDDERENHDPTLVGRLVEAVGEGKAVLVVHPRGKVEIERAQDLMEEHAPETVFWRVAPLEAQGGILGERAAGGPLT